MSIRIPQLVMSGMVPFAILALAPAAGAAGVSTSTCHQYCGPVAPGVGARGGPTAARTVMAAAPRPGSQWSGTRATTCHQYCDVVGPVAGAQGRPLTVRTVVASSSPAGFQWFDAALGFGFACGAMLLGAGALAIKRRRRAIRAGVAA